MLPITEYIPKICNQLSIGRNLVLQAEPGAGKSTALPLGLLDADWLAGKKIVMLEPRRVAAKSIANYLARQIGEEVGQRIGYQIRNERKISNETILEIVTEGVLTRRLQNDPEISDVGLIIFDEFHERSLNADLSLLLSLEVQQALRDDLKLLVMSATIDTKQIARYMEGADIIECPGRGFPVEVSHVANSKEPLPLQVTRALRKCLAESDTGDVLVFLPGQSDIQRCIREAREIFGDRVDLLLLPLFGGLSLGDQEKAIIPNPDGKRKVVFATNIAETSLTIEGVTCVIDSGLEKNLIYDPSSSMTRLKTSYISKASAEQRKGRAGRTMPGNCIRLWSEQKHRSLRDYQGEEILSADLSSMLLELTLWGNNEYSDINWLTPPPQAHYESAREMLMSLALLDSDSKITPLGKKCASLGTSPRVAAMLHRAKGEVERCIACELAALISDRDLFYQGNGVDIVDRLLAIQEYKSDRKSALKMYPMTRSAVEQLLQNARSFKRNMGVSKFSGIFSLDQLQNIVGKLLLFAYPDRLAKKRSSSAPRYQLANGRGVFLPEDDSLCNSDWLVVADCDAQKREGRVFGAASISYGDLEDCLGSEIKIEEQFQFDADKQKITGHRVSSYRELTLRSSAISNVPAGVFQDCLSDILRESGFSVLNWTSECESWLSRVAWLGNYIEGFPSISQSSLTDSVDEWLIPYLMDVDSMKALQKINVLDLLQGLLTWEQQETLNREAPLDYKTPSNKIVPIRYDKDQGPIVSVQLQEMFGQIETPKIAGGKVAIRFELLSPARRPIQTTSDLSNFWSTSYFDVAKEMRGRYPKHRWPEQPLLEKAGKSIKRS